MSQLLPDGEADCYDLLTFGAHLYKRCSMCRLDQLTMSSDCFAKEVVEVLVAVEREKRMRAGLVTLRSKLYICIVVSA